MTPNELIDEFVHNGVRHILRIGKCITLFDEYLNKIPLAKICQKSEAVAIFEVKLFRLKENRKLYNIESFRVEEPK